jgi:phospholipid/cholesterol/gamma-HCH transport system permease protein
MANPGSPSLALAAPVSWVGRQTIAGASYLGGMGLMLGSALAALRTTSVNEPPLAREVSRELAWMFGMGMPLVGLMHVGLGSFLSMQAYFGGTFVDGTGAVVGVGLLRNIAPQMACHILGFLLAARITTELSLRTRAQGDQETSIDRAVAVRLIAAMIAGVILSIWGAAVGTVVGWGVSGTIMGVTTHSFFRMFWEMLWTLDVIGVFVKGVTFTLVAALFACHEGLRLPRDADFSETAAAAYRAACLGAVGILVLNSAWFILFYHARTAFGPTLLKPPAT